MLEQTSVEQFLSDLASAAPTPGGGSAAAVIGAMGAGLISMVCNVTLGKKSLEAAAEEMHGICRESERLRARLATMVDEDIAAFGGLMDAYRMPKSTDEQKTTRASAIQLNLRFATQTPLDCARACAEVITLARRAAELGFSGVISDAGVGVLAANAGLRSAALNVQINAPLLKDRDFAERSMAEVDRMLIVGAAESEAVFQLVRSRL